MDEHTLLQHGDCLVEMASMDAGSVDAVVCDPPYNLSFMGKSWDSFGGAISQDCSYAGAVRPNGTRHEGNSLLAGGHRGKTIADSAQSNAAFQCWNQVWATEALRVLKPSHYLLAFGGTRTWHRLACAIEDAGFEIRDTLMWIYGSGFPKGKASLKPAWEPIILARKPGPMRELGIDSCRIGTDDVLTGSGSPPLKYGGTNHRPFHDHAEPLGCNQHPAGRWPANILIDAAMADDLGDPGRFYFQGDYTWDDDVNLCSSCAERAAQIARHGTAATKACTATKPAAPTSSASRETRRADTDRPGTGCCDGLRTDVIASSSSTGACGRTPTDPCPPDASCTTSTATRPITDSKTCASCGTALTSPCTISGPSTEPELRRWFYCPKASRSERNAGCEGMEERTLVGGGKGSEKCAKCGRQRINVSGECTCDEPDFRQYSVQTRNHHPTVKPLALMRWLVKLVAQPGDVVLDPFAGSCTTGVACIMEGREFVGIEREQEYVAIGRHRLDHASAQGRLKV